MTPILAITRREIHASFVSPIAYAFMTVFLLVTGAGFTYGLNAYMRIPEFLAEEFGVTVRTALIASQIGISSFVYIGILLSLPGLSMRLFSEERKSGTAELLFTSPITTAQLVLGKFLGAFVVFLLILVLTLPLVGVLAWKADLEGAALAAAYLGMVMYGGVILSMGLFASSLTENQFVSLIVTYALIVPFVLLELVVGLLGSPLDDIILGISFGLGLQESARGVVDTHFLLLDVALIFLFLFLTTRVIDSARWR